MIRRIQVFVLSLVCLVSCGQLPAAELSSIAEMPGELVSVGTHRLHIYCTGQGSPTVIIDAGLGGISLEWENIQAALSGYVRVCSYDRAGYGWSDPGPQPRTTAQIARELYLLLVNANVPPPYVLVGHSFGGYNIRYFTGMHPDLVSGVILIDASHPAQFARLPGITGNNNTKNNEKNTGKNWSVRLIAPVIPPNYPADARVRAYILMASRKAIMTRQQELDSFVTSAGQVSRFDHLPDIPLTVITRGKRVWPHTAVGDESEKAWSEMQDELAGLSVDAVHVIAGHSGHLVHLDEPGLVTRSILTTIARNHIHDDVRIMLTGIDTTSNISQRFSKQIYTVGGQIAAGFYLPDNAYLAFRSPGLSTPVLPDYPH